MQHVEHNSRNIVANLSNQKYNMGRRTINIAIITNNMVDSLTFIQLLSDAQNTHPILLYLCQ